MSSTNDADIAAWIATKPTYETIRQAQNERVSRITKFYSAGNAELHWHDDKGDHTEQGETNVIFIRPSKVALTFRKLGDVYLWWGSDADEFWMFQGGDDKKAFLARAENAFSPCCESLPIPFHPVELIDLLGVIEYPDEAVLRRETSAAIAMHNANAPSPEEVTLVRADVAHHVWLIDLPGRWSWRHIAIDPKTLQPTHVDLMDGYCGRVLVSADLADYYQMDVRGIAPGLDPPVPTSVDVHEAGPDQQSGLLHLTLRNPADRDASGRDISPAVFQFEQIARSMRPHSVEILDKNCPNPAQRKSK